MRRIAVVVVAAAALLGVGASPASASNGTTAALGGVCLAQGGAFSSETGWWHGDLPDAMHATLNTFPTVPAQPCRRTIGRTDFGGYSARLLSPPYYWSCWTGGVG